MWGIFLINVHRGCKIQTCIIETKSCHFFPPFLKGGLGAALWHRGYTNKLDMLCYSCWNQKNTHQHPSTHVYLCGCRLHEQAGYGWVDGGEGGCGERLSRTTPPLLTPSYPLPPPFPVISTPPRVVSNLVFVHHQPITWQPCPYPQHRRDAAAWWGFCILNSISWWDKGCRNRALPLC